jgi:GH25 family lysozyme M1 (1,4-beta-N-acetylmuramidase)
MSSRGIDISHHQGSVDWSALKHKHGLTWGACKATQSHDFIDDHFARNWAAMKAAGLVRIAYHFAEPGSSSAATQAARFLAVVKPVKGDVLCLDLEASTLSQARTNAWAKAFGAAIRATACATVIYIGGASGGYAHNGSGANLAGHFDFWWFPRYTGIQLWPSSIIGVPGNTTGWARPHIWQWTDSLHPGYDANVSSLTAAQLQHPKDNQEDDNMPTADEIADAVASKLGARSTQVGAEQWTWDQSIGRAASYGRRIDAALSDPTALAKAIVAELPPGGITQGLVEGALRKVFGSLGGGS